jgi:hypothetical protein
LIIALLLAVAGHAKPLTIGRTDALVVPEGLSMDVIELRARIMLRGRNVHGEPKHKSSVA